MKIQFSLSIRQKLYALGIVCVVGALSLAGTAILFSGKVEEAARVINDERFAPLSKVQELTTHLKEVRFRLAGVLLDQMPIPGSRNHLRETMEKTPVLWKEFKAAVGTLGGDGGTLVAGIDRDMPQLERFAQALEKAYAGGDKKALEGLLEDEWPLVQQKIVKPLDGLLPSLSGAVAEETSALEASARRFRNFTAAAALGVVVATLIIALLVMRSLMAGIREAVGVAEALARGDLTQNIEVRSKDELGQLLGALGNTVSQLKGIIGGVRESTDAITMATKEIASGNADLSQRTEEQASSLEETASSMEEITSTVKQNAENAKQANQLALSASEVAVKGGRVVGEVVGTMSSINESSKKIVDIISVIDGIAFQTNILALNAAVEAARAGEQGRGFAVVASEVRNLAQRSATAAKEIKALIGDSVDKVGAGTKLVDEAGKTMQEIVTSVKRVTDIMSEITAASQEQSSGIEQVNQAITQMDQVTQQNAALVEQAAAAAESLEEQAQNLTQAVSVFRLAQTAPVANVPAARQTKAEVRQMTPRSKAKPQVRAKVAAAKTAPAQARTGTDGEWKEF